MSYDEFLQAYMNSLNILLNPPPVQDKAQWGGYMEHLMESLDDVLVAVHSYVGDEDELMPGASPEVEEILGGNTYENGRATEAHSNQESSNSENSTSSTDNGIREYGASSGAADMNSETNYQNPPPATNESHGTTSFGTDEPEIEVPAGEEEEKQIEELMKGEDYQNGFNEGFAKGIAYSEGTLMDDDDEEEEEEGDIFLLHESISELNNSKNATNDETTCLVEREELLQSKPSKIPRLEETSSNSVSISEVSSSTSANVNSVQINGHRVSFTANSRFELEPNRIIVSLPASSSEPDLNVVQPIEIKDETTGESTWEFRFGRGESARVVSILPREGARIQDFMIMFAGEGQMDILVP